MLLLFPCFPSLKSQTTFSGTSVKENTTKKSESSSTSPSAGTLGKTRLSQGGNGESGGQMFVDLYTYTCSRDVFLKAPTKLMLKHRELCRGKHGSVWGRATRRAEMSYSVSRTFVTTECEERGCRGARGPLGSPPLQFWPGCRSIQT